MINNQPVCDLVFISAERANLSDLENHDRTQSLANELIDRGLDYKMVQGCWQNQTEATFAVRVQFADDLLRLVELAKMYNQDAILLRNVRSECFLIGSSDQFWREKIGTMVRVSEAEAKRLEGWTLDYATGQYWAVK